METLEMIKELAEVLSVDTTKFFKGNDHTVCMALHNACNSWFGIAINPWLLSGNRRNVCPSKCILVCSSHHCFE